MNLHRPALAIFCRTLKENDDPFSEDYYWQAYQDFMLALRERGVEPYLVTGNDSYKGNGRFSVAYTIDHKRKLTDLIEVKDVTVDIVFDRADFAGRDMLVINVPLMYKIGMDKIEMYKHFGELQPFSFIANDEKEALEAAKKLESELIVIKEPVSYGGHHVYFAKRDEVKNKLPGRYPVLMQEFLDTSKGIPGLVSGVHDVRLSIAGGEIIGCYIRQAKPGNLHSNVSQGGKMLFMPVEDTPNELVEAAHKLDRLFAEYPRYYSADFVFTEKGWKLLEINPQLALLPITDGEEAINTLNKLVDYMVEQANKVYKD